MRNQQLAVWWKVGGILIVSLLGIFVAGQFLDQWFAQSAYQLKRLSRSTDYGLSDWLISNLDNGNPGHYPITKLLMLPWLLLASYTVHVGYRVREPRDILPHFLGVFSIFAVISASVSTVLYIGIFQPFRIMGVVSILYQDHPMPFSMKTVLFLFWCFVGLIPITLVANLARGSRVK